jgi:Leucine-rich repeat (LRR) protein
MKRITAYITAYIRAYIIALSAFAIVGMTHTTLLYAQNYTFTAPGGGITWEAVAWAGTPNPYPGAVVAGDAATINAGGAATAINISTALQTLSRLVISGTGQVTLTGTSALRISGALSVAGAASLVLSSGLNLQVDGGVFVNAGTRLTVNAGGVLTSLSAMNLNAVTAVGAGSSIIANGAVTVANPASLQVGGAMTMNNGISLAAGTQLQCTAGGTTNFRAGTYTGPGTFAGAGVFAFHSTFNGAAIAGTMFQASQCAGMLQSVNGTLSLTAPLTVTAAGRVNLSTGNLSVASPGSLTLNNNGSASLTGMGRLSCVGAAASIILGANFNNGVLPAANFASPFNAGTIVHNSPMPNNLTLTGALAVAAPGVFRIAATGNLVLDGTITAPASASFSGAPTALVRVGTGQLVSNALTTLSFGTGFNSLNTDALFAPIAGIMELNAGGTFTQTGTVPTIGATGRLRVFGASTVNGVADVNYAAGSTLEYVGSAGAGTGDELPTPTMNGNVWINRAGTLSMPSVTINGRFTLATGANVGVNLVTNSATLTLSGPIDIFSGGVFRVDNTSALEIAGTGTITPSPMNLRFEHPNLFSSPQINALRISRATPTGLIFALGTPLEVTNQFSITSAVTLRTGANTLRLNGVGANAITPGTLTVESGGRLLLENTVTAFNVTGAVDVRPNGTVELNGNPAVTGNAFSYADSTALLLYSGTVNRPTISSELPLTMNGSVRVTNTGGVQYSAVMANITINGNFTLNNACAFTLQTGNNLTLNGNLSFGNASSINTLGAPRPSLTIGGTPARTLTGEPRIGSLSTFTMNRQGARLVLGAPLTVGDLANTTGLFRLQGGVIQTTNTNFLSLANPISSSLEGGSRTAYVDGPLRRAISGSFAFTSQFVFPVGDSATYLPFALEGLATGTNTLTVEVEGNAINPAGVPSGGITSLSTTEHWVVRVLTGSVTSTAVRLGRVTPIPTTSVVAYSNAALPNGAYLNGGNMGQTMAPMALASGSNTGGVEKPERDGSVAIVDVGTIVSRAGLPLANYWAIGNIAPAPTITSFTPSTGGTSTVATITGLNLTNVLSVSFGNRPARSFTVFQPTRIVAVVDSLTVTAPITVRTMAGVTTSSVPFVFVTAPTISSFTPTFGGIGNVVVVRGRHFDNVREVRIGGELVRNYRVDSLNQITLVVPANARTGAISVGTLGGSGSTTATFEFVAPPVITSFSPNITRFDGLVTVTGANFSRVTAASLGGVPVRSFTINDSNRITLRVGSGATGPIVLRSPGGVVTSASIVMFAGGATIATISPLSGVAGTPVQITGSNFVGVEDVLLGSTSAAFTVLSTTAITALVPLGVTEGTFTVRTSGGDGVSRQSFRVLPSTQITSVTPTNGTGGTVITLTGTNFSSVASLTISGVPVQSFTVLSTTQILAVVGDVVTTGSITLSSPFGTTTATTPFDNVFVQPVITGITPEAATVGTAVVVTGRFLTAPLRATIGGINAPTFTAISSTQVSVIVPPNGTTGTVSLVTRGGVASSTSIVTVLPGTFVTAFVPPFGGVGTEVRILGGRFLGAQAVNFGGVPARFEVLSDSVIRAFPADGTTSGLIAVTTPLGVGVSRTSFSLFSPLQLDSVALAALYIATDGARWTSRTGWLRSRNLDEWVGVSLQGNRVVSLRLPNNNLVGALPDELRYLTALRTLDVSGHNLTGTLHTQTWLASLMNLEELRLSARGDTAITGLTGTLPDTLVALTRLRVLDVSNNSLSGTAPNLLCRFPNLEELNLANNDFTGQIPACIGTLARLVRLDVSLNRFSGALPPELGNLRVLRELNASSNLLTGSLPATFGTTAGGTTVKTLATALATVQATPNLERLDASNNQLSGELPPNITTLTSLTELFLQGNQFSSRNLGAALGGLRNLRVLNLAGNRFGGGRDSIPSAITTLRALEQVNLRNNGFVRTIPVGFADMENLQTLLLDSNALEGAVPQEFEIFPQLRVLSLNSNRLTRLPVLRTVQEVFVANNRLTFADLENNIARRVFVYTPQDSIGEARDTSVLFNTRFQLSVNTGGNDNRYQWVRITTTGSVNVGPNDVVPNYILQSVRPEDEGVYICRVTNTRVSNLTLVSRPLRLRGFTPPAPVGTVQLVFPPDNAINIPTTPELEWTRAEGATEYEVQVSFTGNFTVIATTAVFTALAGQMTGLQNDTRYFWRVRGRNAGGVTEWSETRRFTAVPAGVTLALSSFDFGRVLLNERRTGRVRLTNVTNATVVLRDVDIQDAELNFRTDLAARGTELRPGRSLDVNFEFAPKTVGRKTGIARIAFSIGGRNDSVRYDNLIAGRGAPLNVLATNFGEVRAGRATITSALIVNLGTTATRIGVLLPNTANGVFSLEPSALDRQIWLGAGDTTSIIVRCQPQITQLGVVQGKMRVLGLDVSDTAEADVFALSRAPRTDDVVMVPALIPSRDSAAAGEEVALRLSIAQGDTARLAQVLPQFTFQAIVRFNNNVLRLDPERRQDSRSRISRDPRNRVETVLVQPTAWRQGTALTSIFCRAVSGELDTTSLEIVDFRWLANPNNTSGVGRVFVEVPERRTFRTALCQADGKRLTRVTVPTMLAKTAPNPLADQTTLKYSVREEGLVDIALYDVQGKKVQTLLHRDNHPPGEYTLTMSANGLANGVYFLVLQSPSAIVSERLEVVR